MQDAKFKVGQLVQTNVTMGTGQVPFRFFRGTVIGADIYHADRRVVDSRFVYYAVYWYDELDTWIEEEDSLQEVDND